MKIIDSTLTGFVLNKNLIKLKNLAKELTTFENNLQEPPSIHEMQKLYEYLYININQIQTELKQFVEEDK